MSTQTREILSMRKRKQHRIPDFHQYDAIFNRMIKKSSRKYNFAYGLHWYFSVDDSSCFILYLNQNVLRLESYPEIAGLHQSSNFPTRQICPHYDVVIKTMYDMLMTAALDDSRR